ncbi:MAG: STAS domain-containing protein, partial [Planctomycetota bacterium]
PGFWVGVLSCPAVSTGDADMPLQEWSETTLIAEMNDEPLFSEDFEALAARLEEDGDQMPDVIVNLKDVTRLNSSNLAQLLRLRKMILSRRRRLRICSVQDIVWSVFLMTGLEKLFEFTDDVSTSLASLQIETGR